MDTDAVAGQQELKGGPMTQLLNVSMISSLHIIKLFLFYILNFLKIY